MKVWKRAVGVVKDKNSIYLAGLARLRPHRNPHLEAVVIKATSHDETSVDYKNFQRVYQWARASPLYMKPFVWSLTARMERTRSWVVALKGLMLIHGVFCFKNVPAAHRIGRLPFDLSSFSDGHSSRAWGFDAFVRSYFAYLDKCSAFASSELVGSAGGPADVAVAEDLRRLVAWQALLDLLLQVKPQTENMIKVGLIFEAMICIVTEVFKVYSRICRGIARALVRVYAAPAGKRAEEEARMALGVLCKARDQDSDLSLFFDLCRDMGVIGSSSTPRIERIPDEDLRELERIMNGVPREAEKIGDDEGFERAIVVANSEDSNYKSALKTIIVTDKWEVFEEENYHGNNNNDNDNNTNDYALIDVVPAEPPRNLVLPDLISF